MHDIFFWLICQGNEGLVRHMWAKCSLPVHVALLGSAIAKKMVSVLVEPAKTRSLNLANSMQDWAYGLMEIANGPQASRILQLQVCESFIRPNACMDVAMATGAKKFLTQRHCVKLMDHSWRGGIPNSSIVIKQADSMLLLLFYAVFPLFNPYLWRQTQGQKDKVAAASVTTRTDSVIDALGMVFRVLGDGNQSDDVHEKAMQMLNADGPQKATSSRWVADLFGSNAAEQDKAVDKAKVMGKIASFYTAPIVKFIVRFLIHVVNLVLYTALINNFRTAQQIDLNTDDCKSLYPDTDDLTDHGFMNDDRWSCTKAGIPLLSQLKLIEVLWLVFELSFFSDMRHQMKIRSMKRMPSKIGVGQLAYASDVLVVVSFALRCAMEVIVVDNPSDAEQTVERLKNIYTAYQITISVKVALIFFQTLLYLIIYRPLGVLVVTLTDMTEDVAQFGILLVVTICSFMSAFCGLQKAGSFHSEKDGVLGLDGYGGAFGPIAAPWWALFGNFDPMQYDTVASVFMWLYLFTSSIILVNLLIAMFAETFNRVNLSAEQEFQHMFFDKVQEHQHVLLAIPPVLNLPYVWFDMLRMMWPFGLGCLCSARQEGAKQTDGLIPSKDGSLRNVDPYLPAECSSGLHRTPSKRHVQIDKSAEAQTTVFDGKVLVDAYLAQQAELQSQTLLARASSLNDAMDEAKGDNSLFFCEAKARLSKLEMWMVAEQEHRDLTADPENRNQTERIKRIEVCIGKVMTALNIQETVAEISPIAAARRRKRRNPDPTFQAPSFAAQAPPVGVWNPASRGLDSGLSPPAPSAEPPRQSTMVADFYHPRQPPPQLPPLPPPGGKSLIPRSGTGTSESRTSLP